jgi:hypothetical protein
MAVWQRVLILSSRDSHNGGEGGALLLVKIFGVVG